MAEPAEEKPVMDELPSTDEEHRKQTEAFGGEPDDLDTEDLSAADRGDSLEPPKAEEEDRGDEVTSETEEADAEEAESADDADETTAESSEDGDTEDEEEPEVVDATEEEEEEKAERGIPRHRFNEVNERMKRAEQELAQLKQRQEAGQQAEQQAYDFDKAENEYMELLLDGKTAEAGAKRAEIRAAEREAFKAETKAETVSQVNQEATQAELQSLSDQAERMYPIFSDSHPDFNPALTNKVITYMQGYVAQGDNPGDAFVNALADVIDMYDLDVKYGHAEAEPEAEPKPKVTKKKAIKKTAEKIAVAEKAPPPTTHGKGSSDAGAQTPDISQLSDEEIDALPEATLARLRGDILD